MISRRFVGIVVVALVAVSFARMGFGTIASEQSNFEELKPRQSFAVAFGTSRKVSDFAPAMPGDGVTGKEPAQVKALEIPNRERFRKEVENAVPDPEVPPAVLSAVPMPPTSLSFDGLSSDDNFAAYGTRFLPPDTIGDVGFNHYVQAVNLLVRVYDKSGNPLTPPFKMSSLFEPLGTTCSTRNDGDPNIIFDPLADRWIISQFCTAFPPFRQMIAVSKSGDPTGEYFIYEFVMPNVKLNDYPKFGVWRDAYYMSTDEFLGSDYAGAGAFAFDRKKMLAGDPAASYIYFDLASPTTLRIGGLLPADLDGLRPPPPEAAQMFVGYNATEYGDASDALRIFEFRPDFGSPENSTFIESASGPVTVAPFDPTSPAGRNDIAQPTPGERLDSQSDRLMYRVAYRNHGSSESLVLNQTVRVTPQNAVYRAGSRLYELRRSAPTAPFSVIESATIGDSETSRFMGAAAQDGNGNLAFGYSTSDETKKPSVFYSGRLATEPPGIFRSEALLIVGTGVQRAFGFRWGDYSGLSVDPSDDCSFWITNQYYTQESEEQSDFGWLTRIGKFRYAECIDSVPARIVGSVTNAANGQPIGGAVIEASEIYSRLSGATGSYELALPQSAAFVVTVRARGFRSASRTVTMSGPGPQTENFALDPIPLIENQPIAITAESCAVNNSVEPGERVSISVPLTNSGTIPASDLRVELIGTGGVIEPGPAQDYGTIIPGGAVSRTFSFTAAPNLDCGQPLSLTFRLSQNGSDIGEIVITMPTGRRRIAFTENFDSAVSPSLPAGWSTSATGAQQNWTTSETRNQSTPNSAFSPSPNQIGLNELVSPQIPIVSAGAEIEFRNWYELETTFLRNRLYDGSVLEIKIGSADWLDIETAGGRFLSGGYDGVIDSCCSNPLAGRRGWSGRSGPNQTSEFITSRAKLPPSAAGQNVRFRWRVGNDIGTFRTGQYIDNIVVSDGYICDCQTIQSVAPFDFDGDGRTDLSVFRPSDAANAPDFFIRSSSGGDSIERSWGSTGDKPAVSDFDGDGRTDLAVFRPSSGTWFILGSSNNVVTVTNFGLAADLLVPADYDGDGKSDVAVWRPDDGNWYIINSNGGSIGIVNFGLSGDRPVTADYDGDGRSDIAVYRPSTGIWYVIASGSGQARIDRFGLSEDIPVAGDFNGDGKGDLTVYRPSTGVWYQMLSPSQLRVARFGVAEDRPLQADFDGDGVLDIALFRPSTSVWYFLPSSGGFASAGFGQSNDVAIPSIYVR